MIKIILILLFTPIFYLSTFQVSILVENINNNKIYNLDKVRGLKENFSPEKEIEKVFLEYPVNRFEYDFEAKKLYGISFFDGLSYFVSVDVGSGITKFISQLQEFVSLPMGESSSIDIEKRRYFFVGSIDSKDFLFGLDLDTGKVLFKNQLKSPFVLFEYNNNTDEIYGLCRINGINTFVKYDFYKNDITLIKKIPNLYNISNAAPKIDYSRNTFLFWGDMNSKNLLLEINLLDGIIEIIDAYQVGIDNYKVFELNQKINTVFTTEVQTCTAIVGYSKNSKVGFLAHFSPINKGIEETLLKINEEVRKIDVNGFNDMDLYIVGGVRGLDDSYENVIKVYNEITGKYKVNYKYNKLYHLGKPYNIIINDEEISVY